MGMFLLIDLSSRVDLTSNPTGPFIRGPRAKTEMSRSVATVDEGAVRKEGVTTTRPRRLEGPVLPRAGMYIQNVQSIPIEIKQVNVQESMSSELELKHLAIPLRLSPLGLVSQNGVSHAVGGRLPLFLGNWQKVTQDPTIL